MQRSDAKSKSSAEELAVVDQAPEEEAAVQEQEEEPREPSQKAESEK